VVSSPILSNNNYLCSSVLRPIQKFFVVVLNIIVCFSYQLSGIRDALCYDVVVYVMGVDC